MRMRRAVVEGPDLCAGADGGDTSKVKDELARCNVSTIFSNDYAFAALCSDRTVVAWENRWGNSYSIARASWMVGMHGRAGGARRQTWRW